MPEHLVDEELAAYWTGRPPSTIRRWAAERRITRHAASGNRRNGVRYNLAELPAATRDDDKNVITPGEAPPVRLLVTDRCSVCADTGHVCENHPERPWGPLCCDAGAKGSQVCDHGTCGCGAGEPCPACCKSPLDGSRSIVGAFAPTP